MNTAVGLSLIQTAPARRQRRLVETLLGSCARAALLALPAALSLGILLPGGAQAQTVLGSSTTTVDLAAYAPATSFTLDGNVTPASGSAIVGAGGTTWTLTNNGTVTGSSSSPYAILFSGSGTVVNSASGTIQGSSHFGVAIDGPEGSVDNAGYMTAAAYAIRMAQAGYVSNSGSIHTTVDAIYFTTTTTGQIATISNTGTITANHDPILVRGSAIVTNQGTAALLSSGTAQGVELDGGGTVFNQGIITGGGQGIELAGGYVSNSGSITGGGNGILASASATVSNQGHISGGSGGSGIQLDAGGAITNSGSISGGLFGIQSAGDTVFINTGSIHSVRGDAIDGSSGNDVVTNTGSITGIHDGILLGGTGTVTNQGTASYILGTSAWGVEVDGNATITNQGTITGENGIYAKGGVVTTNRLITGIRRGIDEEAAASVTNTGNISVSGVTGRGILLNAGGYVTNSGAITGGQYGIQASATATVTNTGSISGTNINEIGVDLTAGGLVTNGVGGIVTGQLVGVEIDSGIVSNAGSISGSSGVVSITDGTVVNNASGVITGNFAVYFAGNGTVTNSGSIGGSDLGIVFHSTLATGVVTNTGTITGGIQNGVLMDGHGTVVNQGTAASISSHNNGISLTQSGTVLNQGSIAGATGQGVSIAGGYVSNSGVISAGSLSNGTITGGGSGIVSSAFATVINAGTAGTISGGVNGDGVALNAGGSVINTGTIEAATGATSQGVSIAGGYVSNSGVISAGVSSNGTLTGGGNGITSSAFTTVVNAGTILGGVYGNAMTLNAGGDVTNTGTIESRGAADVGISFGAFDSTLTNAGTIIGSGGSGGTAVQFHGGNDRLVLEAGASFTGSVDGGAGTNTLELAGTNAGSFTGLGGSQFANFQQVQVDSGATWQFTNTNTVGSGVTLTNSGTISNTGTLVDAGGVISNSGTITSTGVAITGQSGTDASIVNLGLIQSTGTSSAAIDLTASTSSTIDNFGTIAAAGSTAIEFGAGTNELVVESGSDIEGLVMGEASASNSVVFVGSGTLANGQLVNFQSASFESTGPNDLWVLGANETVSNTGLSISSTPVENLGTIDSTSTVTIGNGGILSNAGAIQTTVTMTNGGTLSNSRLVSGTAIGVTGSGVITNSGTIIGTSNTGVILTGGSLTNTASGYIKGGDYGVQIGTGAVVTNAGTILDDGVAGVSLAHLAVLNNGTSGYIRGVTGVLFTGSDSYVTNAGTIIGTGGVAVAFGPHGDNRLILETGAVLSGSIDGDGTDNIVILDGTGTLASNFENFANPSALYVYGNWSLTGRVTIPTVYVASGGTLAGTATITGALTNTGTVLPGSATTIGTLTVDGSFSQPSGTLEVAISPTTASKLSITGTANIAGDVLVDAIGTGFVSGSSFTILTAADGVTGTFAGITSDDPLLTATLGYDPDDVFVTLSQNSVLDGLTDIGGTRNQLSTAGGFDAANAADPAGFAAPLGKLDTLDATQLRSALGQLSGEAYADVATMAFQAGSLFADQIEREGTLLATGDSPETESALDVGNRMQLASLGGAPDPFAGQQRPWGFWASGYGQSVDIAGDSNAAKLDGTVGGGAVGLDYALRPGLRIGAALGAASTDFSLDGIGGHASIDQTQIALYADYDRGPAYLDGLVGLAYGDGHVHRDLSLAGAGQASSHVTDKQWLASIEAGYGFKLTTTSRITPFLKLSLDTVDQDGSSESGAGALDLNIASHSTSSAQSLLGARFTGSLPLQGTKTLATDLSLGWSHEYLPSSRIATLAFSADPASSFQIDGARPARDAVALGAGIATAISASTSLYLHYDGSISATTRNHAISAGLKVDW